MKTGQSRFWVTFGSLSQKTADFGSPSSLLPNEDIRNTICGLCLIFFYDVGIETFCGGDAGVSELLGYCHNVRTICQEDRGHSMPERMRIDVWQIVPTGKIVEPAGDAVWVHVASIVCSEYKAGVLPPVAVGDLEPELFPLVQS